MSNRNRHKPQKEKNSIDWKAFALQTISGVISGVIAALIVRLITRQAMEERGQNSLFYLKNNTNAHLCKA